MKAVASVLVACALAIAAWAQEPLVPRNDMRGLERAAAELAKGGRADEWRDLVTVLAQLGLPSKDLTALRTAGDKELARTKKPATDVSRAVKSLREAAALLAAALPAAADEAKRQLATLLLSLDAGLAAAHAALGHEQIGKSWYPAGEGRRQQRRAEIVGALQRARSLEVPIEIGESRGDETDAAAPVAALAAAVLLRPVVKAKAGHLIVYSARSAQQTERILRHTLRGAAVADFVAGGKLEVPQYRPFRLVMLDSKPAYDRAITIARERGWIDDKAAAEARQVGSFDLHNGTLVDYSRMESEAESALLVALDDNRFAAQVLTAGHLNWVCKAFLGTSIPNYTWEEHTVKRVDGGRTSAQDARAIEQREEAFRLAEAGLAGSRTFLRYLAAHREDPAWAEAMLPELGMIRGEKLLKATFVAEFVMEDGSLTGLDRALRAVVSTERQPERFAQALGTTLVAFEDRWREWFVGQPDGLVQRLEDRDPVLPPEQVATLAALNALRDRAFAAASAFVAPPRPVRADEALGTGCQLHARYLTQHPDQAAKWPEAHEENPEHADWSADGAWAGGHAVIAPGAGDGRSALQQWMGTFYHRLPLLDPGLLRVGLGQSGDCVVLDSGSMVALVNSDWHVAWPPADATDVPTHFVAELPNPVPGEDQARFGYPITLQLGVSANTGNPDVTMRLLDAGKEVTCWFSSPGQPTNPELAPPGCFCLIPKAPLKRGTTYTVTARLGDEKDLSWTFRT